MPELNEPEILLVEDNPDDAEMTIRALRKNNLANRLHHVTDGAAALDFLFGADSRTGTSPRMVILDLKLPKIDGMEVLRRIKGDERTRTMPVVILTSSREEKDIVEGYKLGVNSYVQKPVQFDEFVQAVAHLGLYWMVLNETAR